MGSFSQRTFENQRPYESQRSHEVRTPPSRQESQKATADSLVRTFDREDLDIPAFLRRARNNGKS
jgi:hypothetical protein